ncbi:MAG: hypothetical protein H0U71_06575 [Gammaproteobacteria bacterium]|nr:hypothetical protein [Gammaproteobacteria bacterium]
MKGLRRKINSFTLLGLLLASEATFSHPADILRQIEGTPAPNGINVGMWSCHLYNISEGLYRNDLLSITYGGFFAGTLLNCFQDRCYAVGCQRYWLDIPLSQCVMSHFGYRLGLLYGYDERLSAIAGKCAILPCLQFIYSINYKKVGVELMLTGVTLSGGFFIRF